MLQQIFLITFLGLVYSIPKKQIENKPINEQQENNGLEINKKILMQQITEEIAPRSHVDLAKYQSELIQSISDDRIDTITDWKLAKSVFIAQTNELIKACKLLLSEQESIAILLILIISYSFYQMVKQEDQKLKQKKRQHKNEYTQQETIQKETIQILTDSLCEKINQNHPQVSTIHGSETLEERVNKTAEQIDQNQNKFLQRSSSHPLLNKADSSVEELNCLLKDIN